MDVFYVASTKGLGRETLTMVDRGHSHRSRNLCHHFRVSSSVVSLAFVSNLPSFPSKQHYHSHKQPGLWKDPSIGVVLQKKVQCIYSISGQQKEVNKSECRVID